MSSKLLNIVLVIFLMLVFAREISLCQDTTQTRDKINPQQVKLWQKTHPNEGQFSPPAPVIGWDSLMKKIQYPELARRALVEDKLSVEVKLNEFGNVVSVRILDTSANNVFYDPVINAIKTTTWYPVREFGEGRESTFIIPISFYLEEEGIPHLMIKAKRKPRIQRTY